MTEPTPPTDAALFKALKELVVEAQAVADDHHRPRYTRLDQALASARNAMLDYWAATPQPTQPQAGAVPQRFTKAQQERLYHNRPKDVGKGISLADWRRTVTFIEAAHGIGTKGGQHGTE